MRKIRSKVVSFCLVMAVLFSSILCTVPQPVEAASAQQGTAYHGDWTYFAVYNTIYKLNSKTGKKVKVKEIPNVFTVARVTYYNGNLYFVANYFLGTGGEEDYICKMKENGTSFQKLCRGYEPIIYKDKIYFTEVSHSEDGYDTAKGLAMMSLKGTNKKTIDAANGDYFLWRMEMVSGKLYYGKRLVSEDKDVLYQYDVKTKGKKAICTSSESIGIISADAKYLYYCNGDDCVAYNVREKTSKKHRDVTQSFFGGKDGKIYYSDYSTRKMYEYNFATGKSKKIKSNVYVSSVIYSKSGYNVYVSSYSQEEYEASEGRYTTQTARMKADGTGWKTLAKYFES